MSKIDFDKIIFNTVGNVAPQKKAEIIDCIKQGCIQLLDEAAERAEVKVDAPFFSMSKRVIQHPKNKEEWYSVDKQSILKIKEEL